MSFKQLPVTLRPTPPPPQKKKKKKKKNPKSLYLSHSSIGLFPNRIGTLKFSKLNFLLKTHVLVFNKFNSQSPGTATIDKNFQVHYHVFVGRILIQKNKQKQNKTKQNKENLRGLIAAYWSQIGFKSSIFPPMWSGNLMDNLEKQ